MSLHAYILAGGLSVRMGEDKGLLLYKQKPLIQYVIDAVSQVSERLFIVTSNHTYHQFGIPMVSDMKKSCGPAGGIDSVLHHSQAKQNLIVACDMPFIDVSSLHYLIDQSTKGVVTIPRYNQFPEALLGVYSTSIKDQWHALVEKDILKLSDLLSFFETNFANGNQMCESNPDLFRNMNSKDDLVDF